MTALKSSRFGLGSGPLRPGSGAAGVVRSVDAGTLALWLSRVRLVFGVTAIVAPGLAARATSGKPEAVGIEPQLARMLGARDIALALGTILALDHGAPVRGWLEGSALADAGDAVASLAGRKQVEQRSFIGTVSLASASAVLCAILARRLDPAPSADPGQPEAAVTKS